MRRFALLAVLALSATVLRASHHQIVLKDGTSYNGVFVSGTSRTITFQDESGAQRRFDVQNIRSIDFGDSSVSNSVAPRSDTSRSDTYRDSDTYRGRGSANRAVGLREIPAGTELSVRTNERIASQSAGDGRTYSAQIERDVLDSSRNLIIPRGSEATLVVRDLRSGGATGSPDLVLDVQSVTVNGQRYLVSTQDLERSSREGIGKNKRTAEMVGGGAALGTLLGAIAGGGKGALIGAIAGAAAGGAAQVLTRGKEVDVPAETVLTFRLDQPVRLEAYR